LDGKARASVGRRRAGQTVQFSVDRNGQKLELAVKPRQPIHFSAPQPFQPVAINSLGLAIQSSRIVANSSLDGIQAGDEVARIEFPLTNESEKAVFEKRRITESSIELSDERAGWEMLEPILQALPPDFHFKVVAKRNGQEITASGVTVASTQHFLPTRALIAVVATNEASQGTSRLLLFLTLLSANLAIVNFLPIPVLDGGHMLFLAYEGLFQQPPNEKVQVVLTYAGLFLILGLMLYVILLDISRLTSWM